MPRPTAQLLEESHRIGVQFLLADLATALTFLDVSEVTELDESRKRNLERARYAYDTVRRLMPKVVPSTEELAVLDVKLAELRRRLVATGQLADPDHEDPLLPENCI